MTFAGRVESDMIAGSIAFSPDGRWVAAGGHDRTVRLWDTVDGEQKRVLEGHEGAVRGVSFSARLGGCPRASG